MSLVNLIFTRGISTSCARHSKRNFRKFDLINKRGSRIFKKQQMENPDPRYPIDKRGVRDIGFKNGDKFIQVPEMIPELVVPNLEDFKLKPYVTYKSESVHAEEFTPQILFECVYAKKIQEDFENGKLTPEGEPMEPSPEEKLTAQEARDRATQPGADMFIAPPKPVGTLFLEGKR